MSRGRRTLTRDERRLWAQVARAVTPLRGRAALEEPEPDPAPAPVLAPSRPPQPGAGLAPTRLPAPPPLVPLERSRRVALRRGRGSVDAVLDLHGLRQAEAHDRLVAFLLRSRAAGHALILVITGKGGEGGVFDERGVLRRLVPHWLARPDLRPFVLGFEAAAPQHGGAGALYVRLRRARPAA